MLKGHDVADQRSLLLHREVARRLRSDPTIAATARARVDEWAQNGQAHALYVEAWRSLFAEGLPAVLQALEDPGERGQALRQASPFAFVLAPRERWQLLRGRQERSR
ncbi:MAG TPA: hypothetical protein VJN18_13280 [Polyangiaceae bacterium]|nr:hypothetical protein [Polyangiaceae bacterium]